MYVLCSDKKENSAENPASPEQLLRVIQEAVSHPIVLSLVQIRLFSSYRLVIDYFHRYYLQGKLETCSNKCLEEGEERVRASEMAQEPEDLHTLCFSLFYVFFVSFILFVYIYF